MVRLFLAGLLALTLSLGAPADDKKAGSDDKAAGKTYEATITKVDAKNHTVTVKMKDKDGKDTERTFKLTEEVRYADSTGKVVAIDVFKSGDYVLVVEADGKLKELRQAKKGETAGAQGKKK